MGSDTDEPEEPPKTVFSPASAPPSPKTSAPEPASAPPAPAPTSAPPPEQTSQPGYTTAPYTPGAVHGRVAVGDVLNGIYEVKRAIGRGGMAEVYEGVNINGDERVAIKVMLPALAADPNIQAMFRKEARTLTRLSHPALVQYRVLAHEPNLHVLYIVMEFVDGIELSKALGTIKPTSADLRALTKRLAEGLRAAHDLGVVHRDLSPDNIFLPDGRLERAKILDFGIAKDLDATQKTLIGDGFAGKLGYVAPEQFGDFGREIGPWTDVYSLGLVIMAVAQGRDVNMGATLVEAVDKRRAGVDLTPAPEDLRPILARMLAADPAQRLRSMDALLELLNERPPTATIIDPNPALTPEPPTNIPPPAVSPAKRGGPPMVPLAIGGGVLVLAIVAAIVFLVLPKKPAQNTTVATAASGPGALRQAISGTLPTLPCSWLELTPPSASDAGTIKLIGVAGSPASVQDSLLKTAMGAGATISSVNMDEVAPAEKTVCPTLDAFSAIRGATPQAGPRLSTGELVYPITRQASGKMAARVLITMAVRDKSEDFALLGLEPSGKISMILPSRQALNTSLATPGGPITDLGDDVYRLQIDTYDFQGWAGVVLLTGNGPFDPAAPGGATATVPDASWPDKFRQAASSGTWKADMVWYKVEKGPAA